MNTKIITIVVLLLLLLLLLRFADPIKIFILNIIIIKRGILAPNYFWWRISETFIKDGSGINLYNKYKKLYGDFALSTIFNNKIYIVTNNKYIKTILDNSPNIFGVGELKYKFFRSFMSKNVGVSQGCPWKRRRKMNDHVLLTDKIHTYAKKYDKDLQIIIKNLSQKNKLCFNDFTEIGKIMVSKIIFNEERISENIFSIFTEANSILSFYCSNFKINPKIFKIYITFLKKHIENPNEKSLVKLCTQYESNKDEIIHQIPHFIFPIVGLYNTTVPRIILFLCNHPRVFKKVIDEIKTINLNNDGSYYNIYKLSYFRNSKTK